MEQLALFENCMANEGISQTPKNKIEVVNPLPLHDLLHMVDIINKGIHSREAKELDNLGAGHFGTVMGYKDYAIKYIRDGDDYYDDYGGESNLPKDELKDAVILKDLQSIKYIPRLYAVVDKTAIIIERVHGVTVEQYKNIMGNDRDIWANKDNFVNIDFLNVYKEALKDILHLGYKPADLHGENIMVCKKSGMPVIIDVGLFKRMKNDEKLKYSDKSKIKLQNIGSTYNALCHMTSMRKYIEEKQNPTPIESGVTINFKALEDVLINGAINNGIIEVGGFQGKGERRLELNGFKGWDVKIDVIPPQFPSQVLFEKNRFGVRADCVITPPKVFPSFAPF